MGVLLRLNKLDGDSLMSKLTSDMQVTIVTELACFRSNTEVAEILKRDYGEVVDVRHIETYNPLRPGKKPGQKWCELFANTREKFLADRQSIPISHRNVRQRERWDALQKAKKQGNVKLVIDIVDSAAKEDGEMFTNKRELTGKDGSPLLGARALSDYSDEELKAIGTALFNQGEIILGGTPDTGS